MKQYQGSDDRDFKINEMNIRLTCTTPEASKLLQTIMEEWSKFRKGQEMNNYQFAYWLTRYSGLIQPTRKISKKPNN